jgi:RNA polymerase sigma-70 factor (ECF subfamily)
VQDEQTLIKKSLRGNAKAQKALYELHKVKWFMICLRYANDRMEAEDMLQEGLVNIFTQLKQYNHKKANFSAWSNKVIVNAALQHLRKWKRLKYNEDLDKYAYQVESDNDIIGKIGTRELTEMVQNLPDGYRVVFNLYVIEGYKHREIAEILTISENTSKTQLLKAKKMLRARLESVLQY